MTLKKFLQTTTFEDKDIIAFRQWALRSNFPIRSNSPDAHIVFFHLTPPKAIPIIQGYKKAMIFYFKDPNNLLNKHYKNNKETFLQTINKAQ